MTAPSSEGAYVGQPQGLSLRVVQIFNYSMQNKKAKSFDLAFLELLGRLELPTSSLPRMCSTT